MKDIHFFNDHFQNYKSYSIPKAQLVIADIPYNIGKNAYGSNPSWYVDGDNKNGESEKAGKSFFKTDEKSKGSGLGLYITKEALSKINGTITVWSEKNVGSIFTITLPCLKDRVAEMKEVD